MKGAPEKEGRLNRSRKVIETIFSNNSSVLEECALANTKRIFYLSLIVMPVRIIQISIFLRSGAPTDTWNRGIIISHVVILVCFIGIFLITYRLKNRTSVNTTMRVLQYIVPALVMASGAAIVTIDQLVTTNITPFILVSIVVGVVFLIRPWVSALIYLMSYLLYHNLLTLTISNQELLLSNRANGTTAIAIGLLISVMIWRYNYLSITQRRRIEIQQKQLERMAYYDSLTDIHNRHFLNEMIIKEYASIIRHGQSAAVVIIDIDDFKTVNDRYGHLIGDQLLTRLAQLIRSNIRECDTVARFGGEEFVILAPRTSLNEGFVLAEKLRKLIAETPFEMGQDRSFITASFGVSLLPPVEDGGIDNYLLHADQALYRAKHRGKNRVEIG